MIINRRQYNAIERRRTLCFVIGSTRWGGQDRRDFDELGEMLRSHKCVRVARGRLRDQIESLAECGDEIILRALLKSERPQ